jgi:hypothetical protein
MKVVLPILTGVVVLQIASGLILSQHIKQYQSRILIEKKNVANGLPPNFNPDEWEVIDDKEIAWSDSLKPSPTSSTVTDSTKGNDLNTNKAIQDAIKAIAKKEREQSSTK